jgi:hypothetical protein
MDFSCANGFTVSIDDYGVFILRRLLTCQYISSGAGIGILAKACASRGICDWEKCGQCPILNYTLPFALQLRKITENLCQLSRKVLNIVCFADVATNIPRSTRISSYTKSHELHHPSSLTWMRAADIQMTYSYSVTVGKSTLSEDEC